jgi:hypothetical protein
MQFLEYHIFFTNVLTQEALRSLADADEMLVVKSVQVVQYRRSGIQHIVQYTTAIAGVLC